MQNVMKIETMQVIREMRVRTTNWVAVKEFGRFSTLGMGPEVVLTGRYFDSGNEEFEIKVFLISLIIFEMLG